MATQLIEHERIRTTYTKAKALRPMVEKIIALSKIKTITAERRIRGNLLKLQEFSLLRKLETKWPILFPPDLWTKMEISLELSDWIIEKEIMLLWSILKYQESKNQFKINLHQ